MKSKLSLKTERLAELTTEDLHRVHGAAQQETLSACVRTLHGCTTNIYCP